MPKKLGDDPELAERAHEIWREIFYLGQVDSIRLSNYLAVLEKRIDDAERT